MPPYILSDRKDSCSAFYAMLFLLTMSVAWLPQPTQAVQINLPISQAEQQAADLQHFAIDKEIKILQAGDQEFITLIKEQTTGFAKGVAILIPDVNQSIHHQAALGHLYDQLNDYGWTNLLLTMPSQIVPVFGAPATSDDSNLDKPEQADSEQTAANDTIVVEPIEKADTTDTEPPANPNLQVKAFHRANYYSDETNKAIETAISERVIAAWELAKQHPGFFLVICQGKSCHWLTNLFLKQQELKPDAMVMLSAHMPQPDLSDQFAQELSKTEFPVLDLYQSNDNPWVLSNISWRRKMARKHYKTDYRQRQLYSGIDYYGQQQRTLKEIYGFLTAVGM